MCPACSTTLAVIAAKIGSAGGLTAVAAKKVHDRRVAKTDRNRPQGIPKGTSPMKGTEAKASEPGLPAAVNRRSVQAELHARRKVGRATNPLPLRRQTTPRETLRRARRRVRWRRGRALGVPIRPHPTAGVQDFATLCGFTKFPSRIGVRRIERAKNERGGRYQRSVPCTRWLEQRPTS